MVFNLCHDLFWKRQNNKGGGVFVTKDIITQVRIIRKKPGFLCTASLEENTPASVHILTHTHTPQ